MSSIREASDYRVVVAGVECGRPADGSPFRVPAVTHGVDCDLARERGEHGVWIEPTTGQAYRWAKPALTTAPWRDSTYAVELPCCCCGGPLVLSCDVDDRTRWRCMRCQPE